MHQPEKYRQPDQYYIDEYGRIKIAVMKTIEAEMLAAERLFYIDSDDPTSSLMNTEYLSLRMKYNDSGVDYYRNKRATIKDRMQSDEAKDRIVNTRIIPKIIHCLHCNAEMKFDFLDFIDENNTFLMWFSCPHKHVPNRAFYKNGEEYRSKETSCSDCGRAVISSTKKTQKKILITDTCRSCKKKTVFDIEISPKVILPINEAERKKYCDDFTHAMTTYEDLAAMASLSDALKETEVKEKYEFKNIQKLNISQLEETLTTAIEKTGFIKLQFDKPKISRYLTLGFSLQDTIDRESTKSIKAIKKIVETALFPTNWRLMSPGFEYRLGLLSAQLKGYSLEEDLQKIAQEIWEKKKG